MLLCTSFSVSRPILGVDIGLFSLPCDFVPATVTTSCPIGCGTFAELPPGQEIELLEEEEGEGGAQSQQAHDEDPRHVLQPKLLLG